MKDIHQTARELGAVMERENVSLRVACESTKRPYNQTYNELRNAGYRAVTRLVSTEAISKPTPRRRRATVAA